MSFEQLLSLMAPYIDQRSKKEVAQRHLIAGDDSIDVFMVPRFESIVKNMRRRTTK
jgi:hypothetical protein